MANKSKSKSKNSKTGSEGRYTTSGSKNNGFFSRQEQDDEKTLKGVFIKELKDIYNAEQQLVEALPDLAEAAFNEELQDAINNHLDETKKQVKRLEKVFSRIGEEADSSETCEAMEGLIKEAQEVVSEFDEGNARDAAIIVAAQKVEHYEMATYGSLRSIADAMGLSQVADLLDRTLEEEENADQLLTEIAMDVNYEANEEVEEELEDTEQPYA